MVRGTNKILLEEQVYNCIKKYNLINENDKLVIGVSGGPDSICILHVLNALKEKLKFKRIARSFLIWVKDYTIM